MTERLLKRVAVLASIISILLFAGVGWNDKLGTLAKAESDGIKIVALFGDQAGYMFAVHQQLLEMAAERVKDVGWDSVEATKSILNDLEGLDRLLDGVSEILLVDAQGKLRATTMHPQADGTMPAADPHCFLALSRNEAETCISQPEPGSGTEKYLFSLSRRLEKDGKFDGIVQVAVSGDFLVSLWAPATPMPSDVVTMFDANGTVLAQGGRPLKGEPLPEQWGKSLIGAIGQSDAGVFQAPVSAGGPDRITVYSKIANQPIYVSMSLDKSAAMTSWYNDLLVFGLVITTAAAGLVWALGIAIRQARRERHAVSLWEAGVEEGQKMEEQLRQSQKMEGLGKLTGGIAHDFNNLLTVIIGNIDIAQSLAQDAKSRRLLAGALKASRSAATLTQRLLAFARKQILQPTAVDLQRLLEGMQPLLLKTLNADVRLVVNADEDLWPALIDPNQIELVILNLAINARDAMPRAGTLSISASNHEFGQGSPHGLAPGRYVVLTVADTGTGMDEATLARATEPFFSTKPVGEGTGLGLSMIQGFIAQSGGAIRLSSQLGKGTQVEMWLPRALSMPLEDAIEEAEGGSRDNAAILVCDDDPAVLEFVCEALEATGYRVLPASNGQMAISLLRNNKAIRLLLADYTMPEMNGAVVARKVQAAHPSLPILLMTGNADIEAIQAELPEINLLRKPFDRHVLAERVSSML